MPNSDTSPSSPEQARKQLWDLIEGIRFAMFTTRHSNGHLHSRPMTTQNAEIGDDASLWFFMSKSGEPVADLKADPTVNLVYADAGEDTYVSISATAAVVENAQKTLELWSKLAEAWFPGGVTDPDLALVQVKITHANYWDMDQSKPVQLFHIAKALVMGKPPAHLGDHAEIRFS